VKLNFPLASTLVLPAISMPLARLMRMTSSPAAGLLVVPLVTVRSGFRRRVAMVREKIADNNRDWRAWSKTTPC